MTRKEIKYWLLTVMVDGQVYSVSQDQADVIKDLWHEINGPEVQFSFNEGCTKIKKYDMTKFKTEKDYERRTFQKKQAG